MAEQNGGSIVVLENSVHSPEAELTANLLSSRLFLSDARTQKLQQENQGRSEYT